MPPKPSKRLTLLSAYEAFTRKESVCIREENFEALPPLQAKKAKVAEALKQTEENLSEAESREVETKIAALIAEEQKNEKLLQEKMASNRQEYRRITMHSVSANKLRRAYTGPVESSSASSRLKGKA